MVVSKEKPQPEYSNGSTVEFENGSITYSVIGEPSSEHHPVIWVSGAEQGRVNPYDVAKLLAEQGHRQVLIYDQPVYRKDIPASYKMGAENALNFLADGVLAAAEDAGLTGEGRVVDVAAHSLGGLVLDRLKQRAAERGVGSFSQDKGSKQVMIAPTGSNSGENLIWLGGRWVPYMAKSIFEAKILDPGGLKGPALQKNTMSDIPKFIGETRGMAKEKIDYKKFGEAMVLIYPEDRMFPENGPAKRYRKRPFMKKPIKRGFINTSIENGYPLAFATPVGPEVVATKGINRWLSKAAIGTKRRREYVSSYRGAGHNDPTDNPRRTAAAILEYFDSRSG